MTSDKILCESCRYGVKAYCENQIKDEYIWICTRILFQNVFMNNNKCEVYERRIVDRIEEGMEI